MGAAQGGMFDGTMPGNSNSSSCTDSRSSSYASGGTHQDQFALDQQRLLAAARNSNSRNSNNNSSNSSSNSRRQQQQPARGAGGVTVRIVAPGGGGTRVISLQELLQVMPGWHAFPEEMRGFGRAGAGAGNDSAASVAGPVTREALAALSDR